MYNVIVAVRGLIDYSLLVMTQSYDKYVYTPIHWLSAPTVRLIPRRVRVKGNEYDVFTPNMVTLSRTFLVIPVAVSLKYDHCQIAFWCVLLHDYLDHLDGIVAKEHKVLGYQDNEMLGCFLDAFCDKIVNVIVMWTLLLLTDYRYMSVLQGLAYVGLLGTIMTYEAWLGVVRIQDYYHALYVSGPGGRNLSASMAGKLKEKLESMAIMFLCLAHTNRNPFDHWGGLCAMYSLVISIWMAHESLSHKIRGRRAKNSPISKPRYTINNPTQIKDDQEQYT